MREAEAVAPLCMANSDTKIVIAGDKQQVCFYWKSCMYGVLFLLVVLKIGITVLVQKFGACVLFVAVPGVLANCASVVSYTECICTYALSKENLCAFQIFWV